MSFVGTCATPPWAAPPPAPSKKSQKFQKSLKFPKKLEIGLVVGECLSLPPPALGIGFNECFYFLIYSCINSCFNCVFSSLQVSKWLLGFFFQFSWNTFGIHHILVVIYTIWFAILIILLWIFTQFDLEFSSYYCGYFLFYWW
jgi:hypothetical protein